jgi:hypothetical protein
MAIKRKTAGSVRRAPQVARHQLPNAKVSLGDMLASSFATGKVKKAFERFVVLFHSDGDIIVHGSGIVRVPQGRLNEIPKVIREHHLQEAERARLLGLARFVV